MAFCFTPLLKFKNLDFNLLLTSPNLHLPLLIMALLYNPRFLLTSLKDTFNLSLASLILSTPSVYIN